MSDELESVGALATATLAASTLDGAKGGKAVQEGHDSAAEHGACANCGAQLTGPFCRLCGQAAHIHRSLLHLIEEVLHGVWHFDAKGWRTIPLLVFLPGRLTRRYIDGQRKTYVSPLALFLFMVFLTFFVASLNSKKPEAALTAAERQAEVVDATKDLASAEKAVAEANAALDAARKQGVDLEDLQEALNDAIFEQKQADAALKRVAAVPAVGTKPASVDQKSTTSAAPTEDKVAPQNSAGAAPQGGNTESSADSHLAAELAAVAQESSDNRQELGQRLAAKIKRKGWLHSSVPAIDEAIQHALANPELALYKLKNTTYKYSFMLVPISLPFLWLMFFWRRGIAMFDHAVFVLYSLSFMSLLFVSLTLLGMAGASGLVVLLALIAPPVHMFVQLRGTYGLSVFSGLWRTVALMCVAGVVMLLFMLLVLVMSMH
jgi:hypothetical protein